MCAVSICRRRSKTLDERRRKEKKKKTTRKVHAIDANVDSFPSRRIWSMEANTISLICWANSASRRWKMTKTLTTCHSNSFTNSRLINYISCRWNVNWHCEWERFELVEWPGAVDLIRVCWGDKSWRENCDFLKSKSVDIWMCIIDLTIAQQHKKSDCCRLSASFSMWNICTKFKVNLPANWFFFLPHCASCYGFVRDFNSFSSSLTSTSCRLAAFFLLLNQRYITCSSPAHNENEEWVSESRESEAQKPLIVLVSHNIMT